MPNLSTLLKQEIVRLARREIRTHVEPVKKTSAGYRHEIAALKRELATVQRRLHGLEAQGKKRSAEPATAASPDRPLRFVAKGLRSLRERLGLSAADVARLINVSEQSIYNWETKKTNPRKEQVVALASIRGLGKREVRARLKTLGS